MDDSFYLSFPCVLKDALKCHKVEFPEDIKILFDSFDAYRVITRKIDGVINISPDDFLSQIEIHYKSGNYVKGANPKKIGSYSCSFFKEKEELITILSLPKDNKHIIFGSIKQTNGAIRINNKTTHIDLWLYDHQLNQIVSQFEVIKDEWNSI